MVRKTTRSPRQFALNHCSCVHNVTVVFLIRVQIVLNADSGFGVDWRDCFGNFNHDIRVERRWNRLG